MTTDQPPTSRDNPPDLEGCDENHCHGRRRDGSGKACHRPAGWGTTHAGEGTCKLHLGSTRNHTIAAQREQLRHAVATYGLPIEIGPEEALLQELYRTAGHVAYLERRIHELDEEELVWGVVEETDRPAGERSPGGLETKLKAAPHALLQLYQKERQHLAKVSKEALDAGVSERVVQVYEQIAASYVQVLERVVNRLDLSPAQREMVPALIQAELRALAGGDAH